MTIIMTHTVIKGEKKNNRCSEGIINTTFSVDCLS